MDFVHTEGLFKSYRDSDGSEVVAVEDVTISIDRGEFCTIVGPSGCGKTTLLHMIGGLLAPTSGDVYLDGERVTEPSEAVNMVFQEYVLLDWRTVWGNLMLPLEVAADIDSADHEGKAEELLKTAGLYDFKDSYPHQLSGGMKQRVAFLMALMTDPAVILLDEPFGALDLMTREKMNLEILRIWEEIRNTAILVTHDINEAVFLGDRVFVMSPRPGRITRIIEVDLPRPREDSVKDEERFFDIVQDVRRALERA